MDNENAGLMQDMLTGRFRENWEKDQKKKEEEREAISQIPSRVIALEDKIKDLERRIENLEKGTA
jgi:uncharacterized protein YceH (UPF0502 family)